MNRPSEDATSRAADVMQSTVTVRQLDADRLATLVRGQARVLDLAAELGATTDLDKLLKSATDGALDIFDAERATVWVYDPATDELYTEVGHGLSKPLRIPSVTGIAGAVFKEKKLINIKDAQNDPRVFKTPNFVVKNMLSVPLISYDKSAVGVLQVLNKRFMAFDRDDERLAIVLGAQLGVALQRHNLLAEYALKQKLENDLNVARDIQQSLLPSKDPTVGRYEIHGWNRPADQTGGDTFDFYPLPNQRIAMTVCDATGHGIGPALIVAQCRAILRAMATGIDRPGPVLFKTNNLLAGDLPEDRFITAFLGVLDPGQNTLFWASAGHGPMIYLSRDDDVQEFNATGLPLGLFSDMDYDDIEQPLHPGDTFIIMTDGFTEWADPTGEQFGTQRVVKVICENRDQPLPEVMRRLVAAVEAFGQGVPQKDDLTAIIVRRVQ